MMENEEINLRDIIKIIKKHIKILIAAPFVFASIGALVSIFVLDPVYESSTTIIVRQNIVEGEEISKTDVDLSKSLIYTYAEMAKSNTVLGNTKKSLNLGEISGESISVLPVKDTQILEVKVHNKDPELAMNIANTIVEEFMLEIIRITKTDNVAVVDYASLPSRPVSPNIIMNTVISGMLGVMLAMLIVFLLEYFDNTIKTEKDIEKHLKISLIGTISNFMKNHPESAITEAYRKAATNIEFANIDNNIRIIMITSSIAGEGKTTTICNITTVMTDLNKSILLIDFDLRKPSLHKFFNLSNNIGLTDLLINKDDYKKYINNVYPKLDVITVGKTPSNAAEIVNSKAIKELLKEVSMHYDYIFLDTPPIAMVSDPITIATYSDAVILTIAYGATEIETAKKSVTSLKQVNANLIGTILNKTPATNNKRYHYYRNDY